MKYLDEKGVKHLWEKVQELSFSGGGGGGGSDTPSYFEKTYNKYAFDVVNPMSDRIIDERLMFEANITHTLYQNNINIGEFTTKQMSEQELRVLEQVLASFGTTGVQFTRATYISNVSNWMGLLDNSLFGFIIITGTILVSGVQVHQALYFTNTKADGEEHFTIKDTIKIPAKKYPEPQLIWEGEVSSHTDFILNDNVTKFRHIAIMFVRNNSGSDIYPRVLFSPIIEDCITFSYSDGTSGVIINGNVKNPYKFAMTNNTNITTIKVTKIYGIY